MKEVMQTRNDSFWARHPGIVWFPFFTPKTNLSTGLIFVSHVKAFAHPFQPPPGTHLYNLDLFFTIVLSKQVTQFHRLVGGK